MNRNIRSIRSAFAAVSGGIALIAFTMAASSALAGPPVDPNTTRVSNLTLADLDLSRATDVQVARERIHFMAHKLCESLRDPLSLSQHQAYLDCMDRATAGAEPKLEQLAAAQTPATKLASVQR